MPIMQSIKSMLNASTNKLNNYVQTAQRKHFKNQLQTLFIVFVTLFAYYYYKQ